jgi:uncharacterized protein (TIGR03435 family)
MSETLMKPILDIHHAPKAAIAGSVLLAMLIAPQLWGQPESGTPLAFQEASVKLTFVPADGSTMGRMFSDPPLPRATGNRFTDSYATLQELLMSAYGVEARQISGLPDWAHGVEGYRYDIEAKVAGQDAPTTPQLQSMLQSLLADRFQVKLHREMKEVLVYALVVGENGSKLKEVPEGKKPAAQPAPRTTVRTIYVLMQRLAYYLDRPIVDHTGLTAAYEFADLDWRQLDQERNGVPGVLAKSVFGAVQDRLGLKLEPRTESMEMLVIDRAQMPSAN